MWMARPRGKAARASPQLTSERVRDEALRLIEAEGLEGFSTRKLGRALGVEAMAIYWYYPSKDALLDAVVEMLVGRLDTPPSPESEAPVDFIDALRRLAHDFRALAHAYPNAFELVATRRFATEATHRFLDGLFALAERHGLDAPTTARFYRLVASYCTGAALDELAGVREQQAQQHATELRASRPRLAKVFEWLGPKHYDDVFSFGLELLLDALRERAARDAVEARHSTKEIARPRARRARA